MTAKDARADLGDGEERLLSVYMKVCANYPGLDV
jgi:hypothetical protein